MFKINIIALATFLLAWQIVGQAKAAEQDPTRPLSGSVASDVDHQHKKRLVLQSIVRSSDNKFTAIISGNVVQVGAKVANYKVAKITKNEVTLKSPDNEKTLSLLAQLVVNQK